MSGPGEKVPFLTVLDTNQWHPMNSHWGINDRGTLQYTSCRVSALSVAVDQSCSVYSTVELCRSFIIGMNWLWHSDTLFKLNVRFRVRKEWIYIILIMWDWMDLHFESYKILCNWQWIIISKIQQNTFTKCRILLTWLQSINPLLQISNLLFRGSQVYFF